MSRVETRYCLHMSKMRVEGRSKRYPRGDGLVIMGCDQGGHRACIVHYFWKSPWWIGLNPMIFYISRQQYVCFLKSKINDPAPNGGGINKNLQLLPFRLSFCCATAETKRVQASATQSKGTSLGSVR